MTNEQKARKMASVLVSDDQNNQPLVDLLLQMAKWKDEQHEQSLIDLNCKLEEQQACYEELKKRYDEAVERERIATKIINELRQKLTKNN